MRNISAVLISYNEQDKIGLALDSLKTVADDILVVDSLSQDDTPEICRRHNVRLIQRAWPGYRRQKQFATDQAHCDWVLSLDCDEILSPALVEEIRNWKASSQAPLDGYLIPRLTRFMGRWIRRTTWYPDHQLRLFKRSAGTWQGGRVHESFRIDTAAGQFQHAILHETYSDLAEYLRKLDQFSTLAAMDAWDKGRRASRVRVALYPPLVFAKNYLLKRGFLEGVPGFTVSVLAAVSTLFKDLKLWELQRQAESSETTPSEEGR